MPSANPNYSMTDALLVLALACHMVGTNEGVRAAARRIVGKMDARDKVFVQRVIEGRNPKLQVEEALKAIADPELTFTVNPLALAMPALGNLAG